MTAIRRSNSRSRWLAPLLVLFAGVIAYSNSLHGPFIFDDNLAIVDNPQIRSLIPNRFSPPGPTTLSGRPVLVFSVATDYALAGLNVEIYHLTNLVIHISSALLLYVTIRRSLLSPIWQDRFIRSAPWLAAAAAALWAVHPLGTQAVTYVVQRAESLASLFFLVSLYCLIRSAGSSPRWWPAGAVLACGLGMATKETVAAAPIIALLYDRTFLAGSFKQALKLRWKIYVAMAITWTFILRAFLIDRREGTAGFQAWASPVQYAATQLNVIAHYLHLALWPTNLSLDYYDWPIVRKPAEITWQGWVVAATIIATILALKWKPQLGFLGAWFFLILAPTSSLIPINHEAAAEQRMYLPLAAVICLAVVGGWMPIERHRIVRWLGIIAACCAAVGLTDLTLARNQQYSSPVSIWTDTVAKRPNDSRARYGLGLEWMKISLRYPFGSQQAQSAALQAKDQFQIIAAHDPEFPQNLISVGQSIDRSGDSAAAEDFYSAQLPNHASIAAELLIERGILRARRQDWTDAKADYLAAVNANPNIADPHYFLGVLYQQLNDFNAAEHEFAHTLAIDPNYKDAAARLQTVTRMAKGY